MKPTFRLIRYRLSSLSRIRQQYKDYYADLHGGHLGVMLCGLGIVGGLFFEALAFYGRFGPVGARICAVGFALCLVPHYPWRVFSREASADELPYL